ncbi:MAG: GAK system CofD-like protein [Desulfobacterales bacterium]|nr:GAK system CofD-like protein [Desulfobacterales bacterium]
MQIAITHTIDLPDPRRMELLRRNPDLGPRILFFSGGSALRKTSEELVYFTHNSIHIITPVDSGGSSAVLRNAFQMPAIGDIRNRLMALADRGLRGNPEIFRLFAYRMPPDAGPEALADELLEMAEGAHLLVQRVPDPLRKIVRNYLQSFVDMLGSDDRLKGFDLRGASVGNLILTATYLTSRRHFDPAIFIFSKLVNVRGTVRPVANADLHLVAEMENGETIVGQHLLTGKEVPPISSRVKSVYLSESREAPMPTTLSVREKMQNLIGSADLICYPMGSFFSSLLSNLLIRGVSDAIRRNPRPKVFIPSTGNDPELFGHSLGDQVEVLLEALKRDDPAHIKDGDVLNYILLDERNGNYPGALEHDALARRGIQTISYRLVSMRSQPYIDEKMLVPILLSLS